MKKRLLIAAICMFALPLLASNSHKQERTFLDATVMAGHTMSGAYCDCGEQDCICDSQEIPPGGLDNPTETEIVPGQPGSSDSTSPDSDAGIGALFGVLLVFLLYRITT